MSAENARTGSRLHCTFCGKWGHMNTPCPSIEQDAEEGS